MDRLARAVGVLEGVGARIWGHGPRKHHSAAAEHEDQRSKPVS
jgi:hypothetical protein